MAVQDPRDTHHPVSTLHDIVTGGIEGAAGSLAIDPVLSKLEGGTFQNPLRKGVGKRLALYGGTGAVATGLIGALVSLTSKKAKQRKQQPDELERIEAFVVELGLDERSDKLIPRSKAKHPLLTGAGAGAIAAGAVTLPAASRFFKINTRILTAKYGKGVAKEAALKNIGGRTLADYIEGAQLALNTGMRGKVIGKGVQTALKNPEGTVNKVVGGILMAPPQGSPGRRFAIEHYARFRSSPKGALDFMDYEQGAHVANRRVKQDAAAAARNTPLSDRLLDARKRQDDELHYGREKAHAAIKEQIEVHGKNEMEALKHVAYHNDDPQVQNYFKTLADSKAGAYNSKAKIATVSPALIVGGTGAVVYDRKKNQTPKDAVKARIPVVRDLEALADGLIEFDSEATKRSGLRLDKYQKTIRAREIDRHVHDYLASGAIGAVAGAAIPGARSLKERALIGAGVGVAGAAGLHAVGHVDPYGEQTEEAKILQRNAPKYVGAAAVLGGLLARRKKKTFGVSLRPAIVVK